MRIIKFLFFATIFFLVNAPTVLAANDISVNTSQKFQTIIGWEATTQAAQDEYPTAFAQFQTDLINKMSGFDANGGPVSGGLGINRFRVEVYYKPNYGFLKSPYQDYDLDRQLETLVIPTKQRLDKVGQKTWINITVTNEVLKDPSPTIASDPTLYANAVLAVYDHMKTKYGFIPDSWEVALEPANFGWQPYGPLGTYGGVAGALIETTKILQAHGYPVYLVVPSSECGPQTSIDFFQAMVNTNFVVNGKTTLDYIKMGMGEFSYHRYCTPSGTDLQTIAKYRIASQNSYGIAVNTSQLEHIGSGYEDLHTDLKVANVSAWSQFTVYAPKVWAGTTDDGGAYFLEGTTTSVNYGWRSKYLQQYMNYIRPGAVRYGTTLSSGFSVNLDPLVFINSNGKYVAVVKYDQSGLPFTISNLPVGTYGVTYTVANPVDLANPSWNQTLPDQTISAGQAISLTTPSFSVSVGAGIGVMTIFQKTGGGGITPTPIPSPIGDGNADGVGGVNTLDVKAVLSGYLKTVTTLLNQYSVDSKINALDFVVVLKRLP